MDFLFELFNILGKEYLFILIIALFFWFKGFNKGMSLGLIVLASMLINFLLKNIIKEPRPYYLTPDLAKKIEMGYGSPSGNAQNSIVLWGYLGIKSKKFLSICIFTSLMISYSRVYFGVHSLTQIVIGFLIGIFLLGVYINKENLLIKKIELLSHKKKIVLLTFFLCAILMIIYYLYLKNTKIPLTWEKNYHVAAISLGKDVECFTLFKIKDIIKIMGSFTSLLIIYFKLIPIKIYEIKDFKIGLINFFIGVILLLFLFILFSNKFFNNYLFSFIKYFILILVIVYTPIINPYNFIKIKKQG